MLFVVAGASPAAANPYTTIPLTGITNAPLGLYFPTLAQRDHQTLGAVPFVFDDTQRKLWISSPVGLSVTVGMEVAAPLAVHLLLNSYNTYAPGEVGSVTLTFSDGISEQVPLEAGRNVREWRPLEGDPATVNTVVDRRVVEVHRETLRDGATARLDRMAITVSPENRSRVLTGITLTDDSEEAGSAGFLLAGLTVERVPELITFVLDGEIFVSEIDGNDRRQVTENCVDCTYPSLSPGAREVAFVGRNATSGNLAVQVIPVTGGRARVVYDLGPAATAPRPLYTADGSEILFHAADRGPDATPGLFVLYSLDPNGDGEPKRLTRSRFHSETSPAPAPNGSDIVYVSKGRLYRLIGRRKRKPVTRPSKELVQPDQPVFSRDGARVIFRARRCEDGLQCPTKLFSVADPRERPREIGVQLANVSSPALTLDGRRIMASAPGGVWSLEAESGELRLLVEGASDNGSQSSDGLPIGCGPSTTVVCYHPFRTVRSADLRSGPSATAPPVIFAGRPLQVAANTTFGVASETRVRTKESTGKLSACPSGSAAPPSAAVIDGYRWGYVAGYVAPATSPGALPAAYQDGAFGWIAESDLAPATDVTDLCGPTGMDYQCNQAPSSCQASTCNRTTLVGYGFERTGPSEVPCNTLATQPLNAALPIATPTRDAFAPSGWLLAGSRVVAHFQSTPGGEWSCVEVVHAKAGTVPASTFGWIRTPFDYDHVDPYSLWCGPTECGDGVVDAGSERTELCDDGNQVSCDGCETTCKPSGGCGDGFFCPGRDDVPGFTPATCDDGNTVEADQCTTLCRAPFCGDSRRNYQIVNGVQVNDECDDGNTRSDDDCINCKNWFCGDWYLNAAREQCENNVACPAGYTCSGCLCYRNPDPTGTCWIDCKDPAQYLEITLNGVTEAYCRDACPVCLGTWGGVRYRVWAPYGGSSRIVGYGSCS